MGHFKRILAWLLLISYCMTCVGTLSAFAQSETDNGYAEYIEESPETWEPINPDEDIEPPFFEDEEDPEVELEGIFTCDGNHYETKSNNVTKYNKYKSGRKSVGKIAKKGTVVKVVDTKYSGAWLVSDKYYKLSDNTWVLAKNLKSHDCVDGTTKTTYEYSVRKGDNKYHNVVKKVTANKCKKCNCVIKKATEKTSKEKHSGWYDTGYCGVCNYKFKIEEDKIKKADFELKEDVYLRSEPYTAASKKGDIIKKGKVISINKEAKNAHGNLWYKTSDGKGWVYSGSVSEHTHHYSSSTGKCSCGKMFDYEEKSMTRTAYQPVSGQITQYAHPYKKAANKGFVSSAQVIYIDAYSYSDPNGGWISKGDKWFRTTDDYWVLAEDVKKHNVHKYSEDSIGKCTYSGCNEVFEYDIKWIHPLNHKSDAYETKGTNKYARSKPYSNTAIKQTFKYKYQIVNVDRYATNANGEKWYRTTEGYWIKGTDVRLHSHRTESGSCTSVDCGYVINIGLKTCSSKLYETTSGNVPVKEKPFSDAITNRTLENQKSIKINAYTTKLDQKWYRTTDNKYIEAKYVKEHVHSYKDGYCKVCGQYAKYTTENIVSKIVETSKDGVTAREKPYNKAKVNHTYDKKGSQMVIVEEAENYYKDIWYRTSTGDWVYSKDVKIPKGTISTSNKAKVENYIITVTDNRNNPIENAIVRWLDMDYKTDSKGNAELVYVSEKTDFTVSAPGYDSLSKKDYTMNKNRRDSVALAKEGSFEAVNVNMTYVGDTTDLLKSERSINHYHTQGFFDHERIKIECVMGSTSGIGEYRLVQGKKVVATSKDGVFKNLKTKDFAANKKVELEIFDTSGVSRAKQKLLLNVFNITDGGVSNGFTIGASDLKLSFGDGTPFLGGLDLSFDLAQTINFAVNVGDESTIYTLGFSPKFDDDGNFEYTSTLGAYKKFFKNLKECKSDGWIHFYNKHKEALDGGLGKWDGGVKRIGGYIEKIHGQNVYKGKLFIEISIGLENYHQTILPPPVPIPVIVEVEVEAKATPNGNITLTNIERFSDLTVLANYSDFSIGLDIDASVEVGVGVGIKYVASISLYGKLGLVIEGELVPKPGVDNVYLYGTVGLKAKILDMEVANLHLIDTPSLYIVKDREFVLFEDDVSLDEILADEKYYAPISRDYLENRSGWYDSDTVGLFEDAYEDSDISIVVSDFDFNVLQSSTYTDIRPQVVTADGIIMMVYNDDNSARAGIDKSMLVYSLYDTDTKKWSEPLAVYDDTTADYGFSVCSFNDSIYIAWQNAKSLHAENASLTDISKNTEIYVAKYDPAMESFQNIEQVTSNEKYEFMPRIASVNGKTVVAWYENSLDNVMGYEGENTVRMAYKYDEDYAPDPEYVVDTSDMTDEELDAEILPSDSEEQGEEEEFCPTEWIFCEISTVDCPITSLAAGYMLDESYVAYTTDADGNTSTNDDRNIWLYDTQTDILEPYTDMATNVEFTSVHGDRAMTWYNKGMIYYALDCMSAPQQLYTEAVDLGDEYHIISDDNGNMAILFSVKEEGSSDAYIILYDDSTFEWGRPIPVTNQDKYIENFNGAYSDGMIVSIFNQTEITGKEMDETNNLCSAVIGERYDLAVISAQFKDFELEPGAEAPLTVEVRNNGTLRISSFNVNVYDGEDVVAHAIVEKVLGTGESASVELNLTMPETIKKTTYRVEVDQTDKDDAYNADNGYDITVGRAALTVTAESCPTETENIVVVTVENSGYEPSGGMLALFDDNDNITEILVESFEPVARGESYTCAILLDDAHFDGNAGKVFNIGVVAAEEQDIDLYNMAYVYAENVHHDNLPDIQVGDISVTESNDPDEISLMEETKNTVTAKVRNDSDDDIENAQIIVTAYDDRGIYLDTVHIETVSLVSGEEHEFTAVFESVENISMIKISLVNSDNLEPLTRSVEIRLMDDMTDGGEESYESSEDDVTIEEAA